MPSECEDTAYTEPWKLVRELVCAWRRGGQNKVCVRGGAGESSTEEGALELGLKQTLNLVGGRRA